MMLGTRQCWLHVTHTTESLTKNLPHGIVGTTEWIACGVSVQALAMRDTYEAEDDIDDAADEATDAQHDREALAAAVQPLQLKAPAQVQPAGCTRTAPLMHRMPPPDALAGSDKHMR